MPRAILGLERATTLYVAFLDNDVVVEPGWLEALVRCAEESKPTSSARSA